MTECLLCQRPLKNKYSLAFIFSFKSDQADHLCADCRAAFQEIDLRTACPACSRPQDEASFCPDCRAWQKKYPKLSLKHQALFLYNQQAKDYLKTFKVQGDLVLAQVFKKELLAFLKPYQKDYQLVPIPQSQESFQERGFNQVEKLLEVAGLTYHRPLKHRGQTIKQAQKNRQQRLASPQPFYWDDKAWADKEPLKILLLDDIYTTGRTLIHAKELIQTELTNKKPERSIEIKSFSLFR